MRRQTIYPLLIATLTMIIVMGANAQTKGDNVSEARIRRLLSQDGTENRAIQFNAGAINRAQTLSINPKHEISPNSPQELRALIFENYTAPASKGVALRSTAIPKLSHSVEVDKLPSESAATELTTAKQATAPVQTPPTQGNTKEDQ